jgi:alpha-1,3-mannosyltransferase
VASPAAIAFPSRRILGVDIVAADAAGIVEILDDRLAEGLSVAVAFANANLLNCAAESAELRAALSNFLVVNDGVGVDLASRLLYRSGFVANLNGTDMVPYYLANTAHALRIYMLGATPAVVERAAETLAGRHSRHKIAGFRHGYFAADERAEAVEEIRASRADLLLVALGNPKQELWLARHFAETGCGVGMGVGALFDFTAGAVRRAPTFVRNARAEWIYRLALEPRRLGRRYLVGNGLFLYRVVRQRLAATRPLT